MTVEITMSRSKFEIWAWPFESCSKNPSGSYCREMVVSPCLWRLDYCPRRPGAVAGSFAGLSNDGRIQTRTKYPRSSPGQRRFGPAVGLRRSHRPAPIHNVGVAYFGYWRGCCHPVLQHPRLPPRCRRRIPIYMMSFAAKECNDGRFERVGIGEALEKSTTNIHGVILNQLPVENSRFNY